MVVRKTLTGESEAFTFEIKGHDFLVKNFTESDIFVNFDPITVANEETSYKIPSMVAQLIDADNYLRYGVHTVKTDTIYVKGTGEVEVDMVCR